MCHTGHCLDSHAYIKQTHLTDNHLANYLMLLQKISSQTDQSPFFRAFQYSPFVSQYSSPVTPSTFFSNHFGLNSSPFASLALLAALCFSSTRFFSIAAKSYSPSSMAR